MAGRESEVRIWVRTVWLASLGVGRRRQVGPDAALIISHGVAVGAPDAVDDAVEEDDGGPGLLGVEGRQIDVRAALAADGAAPREPREVGVGEGFSLHDFSGGL